jgi:hypothetical protein
MANGTATARSDGTTSSWLAGVVVVVRPDQYVAHVLPLQAPEELERFLAGAMVAGASG